MEPKDSADNRTFKLDFSKEGTAMLSERVRDKLKAIMDEYNDDNLVDYVIVLLRNGRTRNEAKSELDVFLGDDSESFVTWLWDHLSSNVGRYVRSRDSWLDGGTKSKSAAGEHADGNAHHQESDSDRGKSKKSSKSRHSREWKGLSRDVAQAPPLRSSDINDLPEEKKSKHVSGTRQSVSPDRLAHRKKSRLDDRERPKVNLSAPRRLLQFAVRDAVATNRTSTSSSEPSSKRLRSVVSTTVEDSLDDVRPKKIQSVARMPSGMATAIRAVAEAAEDVRRVRPAGNVFDRLSRRVDAPQTDQVPLFRQPVTPEDDDGFNLILDEDPEVNFQRSDFDEQFIMDSSLIDNRSGPVIHSPYDNDGYNDVNVMDCRIIDPTQSISPYGKQVDDSMMIPYREAYSESHSEALRADAVGQDYELDLDQPFSIANSSHRIANNISKVNTWRSSHRPLARQVVETQKSVPQTEVDTTKSDVAVMKENNKPAAVNGNVKHAAGLENEAKFGAAPALGPYSTSLPLEDADSRTIFISNVHFAATKDSLSRHFNKFGEVLKVIILSDPATGQPKGSAYVEFTRKEAAENALSLDGTSFMSRILKVVRKSSVQQEANSSMAWPRVARASPFTVSRFGRTPFPRTFPGTYRGRPAMKSGMRSMQWKRDAQPSSSDSGAANNSNYVPSQPSRGLTYVRTEAKGDGNSETA